MSLRIIKRDPSGEDKEVILEIDPTLEGAPLAQTFSVTGKALDTKAVGQPNVTIRAYDKGLNVESLLGEQVTNAEGTYLIYYSSADLPTGKLRADLIIKAYDTSGAEDVLLAQSPIFVSALKSEKVDLVVAQGEFIGQSEFDRINEILSPELVGVDPTAIDLNSVGVLATKYALKALNVGTYLKARVMADEIGLEEEVVYGLLRFKLPYKVKALLQVPADNIREAILAAAESNIISQDIVDNIEDILAIFRTAIASNIVQDNTDATKKSNIARLLDIAGIAETTGNPKQTNFYRAYLEDRKRSDFWTKIVNDGVLTAGEAENVQFVLKLSVITQSHPPLVKEVYDDADYNTIEDLGNINRDGCLSLINRPGVGVPRFKEADWTTERKNTYAEALITAIEEALPSKVLIKSLQDDPQTVGRPVVQFGLDNPDYDFRAGSPIKYIVENPISLDGFPTQEEKDAAREDLYKTRRLWQVSKGFDKRNIIKELEAEDLDAAEKITRKGRRNFENTYGANLGGVEIAREIYVSSAKRVAAALALQAEHNPNFNNINPSVITGSPVPDADLNANPQLEVFFGSQDYCECTHCRSSFSPAAYLIDLINFLREAQSATPPSAWNILQGRRPDIQNLELSCENTNTPMPYIDLVNEVLEFAIAGGNSNRQTTYDENTLKVEPEHINTNAYDTLANANYPWILPFHLWNEEGKAFLAQREVQRSELMRHLTGSNGQDFNLSVEQACVYLGISTNMYDVLKNNSNFTEFYGGSNTSQLNSLSSPAKNGLLDRSGLEYNQLLTLLETTFVNPSNKSVSFANDSCSIDDATLGFVASEYRNLHRFVRLSSLLGWDYKTLDTALSGIGQTNIVDSTLIYLASIQMLSSRFRLSVDTILTWYAPISAQAYGETVSEYENIFLNPFYYSDASLRSAFENAESTPIELITVTGEVNTINGPVVTGVLNIKSAELIALMEQEGQTTSASRSGLSHLYRVVSFCRAMRLTVQEYLDLKAITGKTILANPATEADPNAPLETLSFLAMYDDLKLSGLSINTLNYLLRHEVSDSFDYADDSNIIDTLTVLRRTLQSKLEEKGIYITEDEEGNPTTKNEEGVRNLFLLFFKELDAARSLEIVIDVDNELDIDKTDYITTNWADLVTDPAAVASQLNSLSDITDRYTYIFDTFYPKLVEILSLNDEVSQFWADELESDQEVIGELLVNQLNNAQTSGAKAISLFTGVDFSLSSEEITNTSTFQYQFETIRRLQKIVVVINGLSIKADQLNFVINNTSDTQWYDVTNFPLNSNLSVDEATFFSLLKLIRAYNLEARYPATENKDSIIDLLSKVQADTIDLAMLQGELSSLTGWDLKDIQFLSGTAGFNLTFPGGYYDEQWLTLLENIFIISNKLGASAPEIVDWVGQDLTASQAQSIRLIVKSNYDIDDWYKVAGTIKDTLREQQRDALTAYLLSANSAFNDSNDLYSHYLIDTEMSSCTITSRIKLTISSIQLWVQRIRMGLEANISFTAEDMDEWNWRKNYRVWEAARKVFTYPENWLEPELREDKSQFFEEMEDDLLQDEVTEETAERAYLNYLHKLDDVAQLEMAGTYKDEEANVLHVYARTKNSPHIYYYRRWENEFKWTDWERLDVDIEGNHLIPTVFNRRPMIFWPVFSEKPSVSDSDLTYNINDGQSSGRVEGKRAKVNTEVQIAYSEYKNNKWQAKKLSDTKVVSNAISTDAPNLQQGYLFKVCIKPEGLYIDVFYQQEAQSYYAHHGAFYLNNCTGELTTQSEKVDISPSTIAVAETQRKYMKLHQKTNNNLLQITESFTLVSDELLLEDVKTFDRVILNKTPSLFKLTYPVTGIELLSNAPFFYEDRNRTFFVVPNKESSTKEITLDFKVLTFNDVLEDPIDNSGPKTNPKEDDTPIDRGDDIIPTGEDDVFIDEPGGNRLIGDSDELDFMQLDF